MYPPSPIPDVPTTSVDCCINNRTNNAATPEKPTATAAVGAAAAVTPTQPLYSKGFLLEPLANDVSEIEVENRSSFFGTTARHYGGEGVVPADEDAADKEEDHWQFGPTVSNIDDGEDDPSENTIDWWHRENHFDSDDDDADDDDEEDESVDDDEIGSFFGQTQEQIKQDGGLAVAQSMALVMDELGWTEAIDVLANAVESWNDDFMLCKTNVDYYKSKYKRLKHRLNDSRVTLTCLTTELWTTQETVQQRDSEIIALRQDNDDLLEHLKYANREVASLTHKLEESLPRATNGSVMAAGHASSTSTVCTTHHESSSAFGDATRINAKTCGDNPNALVAAQMQDPSWQNHHFNSSHATAIVGVKRPNRSNKFVLFRRLRFWKKKK